MAAAIFHPWEINLLRRFLSSIPISALAIASSRFLPYTQEHDRYKWIHKNTNYKIEFYIYIYIYIVKFIIIIVRKSSTLSTIYILISIKPFMVLVFRIRIIFFTP